MATVGAGSLPSLPSWLPNGADWDGGRAQKAAHRSPLAPLHSLESPLRSPYGRRDVPVHPDLSTQLLPEVVYCRLRPTRALALLFSVKPADPAPCARIPACQLVPASKPPYHAGCAPGSTGQRGPGSPLPTGLGCAP